MKSWSRLDWLNLFIFAALVALFYWRILTPNPADRYSFPPGDFQAQFWAFTTLEARQLSAGQLPLWNPYTYAGAPFWADVQAAVFYPPSLLTLLLSAPWGFSLFALELEAIAHFWLAACFMYLFVRRLTASRPAAFIAALTFTFSGYLTGYPSQQLAVLEADVWLPLILFFLHQARPLAQARLISRPLLLAGAAWGLTLLAGHPQSALIVAYLSSAYFLFLWLAPPRPARLRSHLGRAGLQLLLFWGTGLALAAIQFIPAVEYTRLSVRAAGLYEEMSGGLPVTDLIQILLPGQVSLYSPLYVGAAGLLLAGWAAWNRPRRPLLFWAGAALLTLLISLGGNSFLYSPLYLIAPGFSIFRGQERWAFATAFSLAVLSGYGFRLLLQEKNSALARRLVAAAGWLLLFGLLLVLAFFYGLNDTGWRPDSPFYGLLEAATLLTLLLSLIWLLWKLAPRLSPFWLTAGTAALICFDLFSVNWTTNLYPQPPEWHTQTPAAVRAIEQDAAQSPPAPFRVYNEFRLYDNYGVPYQLEDLWGASPLRPARYVQFLAPPMPIERTWELLNVKYVITWREALYLPSTIIYQEPAPDGMTYVHRLAEVGPRAWLVTQTQTADDAATLAALADPEFDRWEIALLEPEAAAQLPEALGPPAEGRAEIIAHTSQALTVQVETPVPALLLLSEPHYPGWQATVDGQPAPLLRADYILRAVPVPAGQHRVELTFQPLSFTLGAIISGLALVGLVVGLWRGGVRSEE